jgi:ribosomal protein S18 acetylase RimI-like enzyme
MSRDTSLVPRSLVWATDIDALPLDRVVERRPGYLVVRSPTNPTHYWGNLLLFDGAPQAGDAARSEVLFDAAFADEPLVRHRTFGWDATEHAPADAEEFARLGYDVETSVGLIAETRELVSHPRANREVTVRALDPAIGADAAAWQAIEEQRVVGRDEGEDEASHRAFVRARLEGRRMRFRRGGGAWFAALDPATGDVVGSCGIIVAEGRGRFQDVEVAEPHRRRGICSRLVVEAARHAGEQLGAERLAIVADAGYHALGLYESLGFARAEDVLGVRLTPRARDRRSAPAS